MSASSRPASPRPRARRRRLRVFVGLTDRTGAAKLTSSDPKVVMIQGDMVCAVAPGKAEITATFPGSPPTGKAYVTVNNEEITEVIRRLDAAWRSATAAGCRSSARPPAASTSCSRSPTLTLSAGGQNPAAIALPGGHWVKGVAVGEATVEMDWRDKLKGHTAVTVTNDPWTDLQIRPAEATINKGEALRYEVTANKGGQVRVLTPGGGPAVGRQRRQCRPGARRAQRRRQTRGTHHRGGEAWPRSPPRPPWT